jgi:mono/diheme cytochrome c family protein
MKRAYFLPISFVLMAVAWLLYPREKIDFNTQVKPVFNKKCIACHGGVRRKSGFSLLFRQDALAANKSGKPAIIPGKPDESELISRITHTDPEERMPYRHEALSPEEIDILTQWIKEGAEWGDHWAYVKVKDVKPPEPGWFDSNEKDWARNNIDLFVYDKMREQELHPSPEADKRTILRRASLDLTGLPAPEELSKKFLADSSDQAYEKLVDALLASPHYGERWTAPWLDLARYADTKGYERDYVREIWRYRDWLIHAFNNDKPYNEFLTEQLAGDLLPEPTDEQLIATAFHRNSMTNDEGGTDNEEFRTAAVLDRVNTTWESLMGTTFACTQCHSHPYDPFRHEEYYKFMAFFNNTRDEDTYEDYPLLREFKTKEDSAALSKIATWMEGEPRTKEVFQFIKLREPATYSMLATFVDNSSISDNKWLIFRNHGLAKLNHVDLTGATRLIFRSVIWGDRSTLVFHLDSKNGPELARVKLNNSKRKWVLNEIPFLGASGVHDVYISYESSALKTAMDDGMMFDYFHFTQELPGAGRPGYDDATKAYWQLLNAEATTTPVMMENLQVKTRTSNVFERGSWLSKGAEVKPGTPGSLNPFPANAPANRLGLAQWMVSPDHPLTSRTLVNRVWEQLFGMGLSETLEDLGTQGVAPTHPELLDHLAWQFMHEDKWSMKKLIRKIMLSATYRQDSRFTPETLKKDPSNRFYARGPRTRLTSEQVRDLTLAVSGLLSNKMYGPGVKPFQPAGIWLSPYNDSKWVRSKGEDGYRRAVYTYWKRTAPYPSMILFDGIAREVCSARRIRTNTPLQALVTLNDSSYVEAARHLAIRMKNSGPAPQDQISNGYLWAVGKSITGNRLEVLMDLYRNTSTRLVNTSMKQKTDVKRDIALELVASAILNLDEFITKN